MYKTITSASLTYLHTYSHKLYIAETGEVQNDQSDCCSSSVTAPDPNLLWTWASVLGRLSGVGVFLKHTGASPVLVWSEPGLRTGQYPSHSPHGMLVSIPDGTLLLANPLA